MSNPSEQALKKQKIYLLVAVVTVGVVVYGIGNYIFNNYQSPSHDFFKPRVDLPVDEFHAKEVWMDRLEAQVNFLSQKQTYYEDTLLEYKAKDRANEEEKIELKRHLAKLKREIDDSAEKQSQPEENHSFNFSDVAFLPPEKSNYQQKPYEEDPFYSSNNSQRGVQTDPFISASSYPPSFGQENQGSPEIIPLKAPLCEYTMPHEEKNELFPVEKRTPANVSVRAILISSVDAVCRLDAQSDPIPVKLRLLDDGHLPGGVTVKLKGCLIGASAYGDISSERVYMRLENLTKVNPNGQAIETEVTGYVSGEDGRFGMRGTVVDRSAKILKPALGSGILSGIAQTLQSACARPSRETINAYTVGADFAQNSAGGAADAFSMLASYYIKRAEQVQPVLQVDAGRIVDITFTQGFSMGDIHAKINLKKVREISRKK